MNLVPHQQKLDEVLRKIGRNVLHFQRMESMLKFLISRSSLEGTAGELRANHENAIEAVSRQTMGNLVKQFFEVVYADSPRESVSTPDVTELCLSVSYRIQTDQAELERQKAALNSVVEQRNTLIHQMLARFDQNSVESCRELIKLLDAQATKVRPVYEHLHSPLEQLLRAGRRL